MEGYYQLCCKQYQSCYNRIVLQFYFMGKLELHVAHIASVWLLKKKEKSPETISYFLSPKNKTSEILSQE